MNESSVFYSVNTQIHKHQLERPEGMVVGLQLILITTV